jgi:UDP-N-acetylmuramyl tripeptide synthase
MEGAADVFKSEQDFPHAGHDLLIRELTLDSRNVRAGDLFLAMCRAASSMAVRTLRCICSRCGCRGL